MLFSFASVAISLWLGLVAVGCLRRLWGASANDGSGYSGRDYARAANSENHHRHRDLGSEGLISTISQSLIAVSHVLTNVIRAALSRTRESIWKMFRRSEIPLPLVTPISTTTLGTSAKGRVMIGFRRRVTASISASRNGTSCSARGIRWNHSSTVIGKRWVRLTDSIGSS